ncbi:hypothetical protein [Rubrolithibacter danxiaensis]|uniref:hypothetical protein n=1 Tax=Rubrolithibacter danxiaensis TaxID=3390805 RepID=UPI003BF887E6
METERLCLDCGGQLRGRADKKFCDDQCRSNYNNRLYNENNTVVKNINAILKRNRRILEEFNPTGKTKISRKKLVAKGFDFGYITSIYNTQTGKSYFFVYEFGYLCLSEEELLLVKKEES